MTHHARLNLIMFATIAGLMAFIYFKPQSQGVQEYSISSGSVEAMQSLRIVRQQQEIALKRLDDRWYLMKPVQARADEKKVREILEILVATGHQRFPLADLERFGLDQPNVQLYIDDEYFGFGGFAPTTHQQYVATGDHVYLISPRYVLALPSSASDLISPELLASNEIPVRFELNHLTVELQNESWHVTTQHSGEALDKEAIKHWTQLWQATHAGAVTLGQEFGSDFVEKDFIKISLQDGQKINLKILQSETEIVFLRVDGGIGYHFSVDAGQQLLDPYATKTNQAVLEN
ncbi:MAG: DUF4340 domain-containing protein [Nitrosomonas sp.]|nr:DUF4340 domain-containing protein [Nitrosomonas sp.]